jgi:hypothetical protein
MIGQYRIGSRFDNRFSIPVPQRCCRRYIVHVITIELRTD